MIALSCFSDMAYKKRQTKNIFQNTSYENKPSKVAKLIKLWIMDALKCKNNPLKWWNFLCNDIAPILGKACGISRGRFVNISSSKSRKKIHIPRKLWAKILVFCNFEFISQTSPRLPTLNLKLAECKMQTITGLSSHK